MWPPGTAWNLPFHLNVVWKSVDGVGDVVNFLVGLGMLCLVQPILSIGFKEEAIDTGTECRGSV